jgi:hypothetical protein
MQNSGTVTAFGEPVFSQQSTPVQSDLPFWPGVRECLKFAFGGIAKLAKSSSQAISRVYKKEAQRA